MFVRIVYVLGMAGWLGLWLLARGGEAMTNNWWLLVPFVACPIVLSVNVALGWSSISYEPYETEVKVIEFVERNGLYVVTAVTGAAILATLLYHAYPSRPPAPVPFPPAFLRFEAAAFMAAVVGVFPLYWIPSKKVHWLVILRHVKTVPLSYGIFFFLAAALTLFYWLGTAGPGVLP